MVHAADLIRLPMPLQGHPGHHAPAAAATPARSAHPLDPEGMAWLDRVAHAHAPGLQLGPPQGASAPAPPQPQLQAPPAPQAWRARLAGRDVEIGLSTGVAIVVLGAAMLCVLLRALRRPGRRLGLPRIRVQQPTPQPELGLPRHSHDIDLQRLSSARAPRQAAASALPRAAPRAPEPWPGSHRPPAA